jgi:hypothetical protein
MPLADLTVAAVGTNGQPLLVALPITVRCCDAAVVDPRRGGDAAVACDDHALAFLSFTAACPMH